MHRLLLLIAWLTSMVAVHAGAEERLIDDFAGGMIARAEARLGENPKYRSLSWEKMVALVGEPPIGNSRHYSSLIYEGSGLTLSTQRVGKEWYLVHRADKGTRGASVMSWDGRVEESAQGGMLSAAMPMLSTISHFVLEDIVVDIPDGSQGTLLIKISIFDVEDPKGDKGLTATVQITESTSISRMPIPVAEFKSEEGGSAPFSGKIAAMTLTIDGGSIPGISVRIGALRLIGAELEGGEPKGGATTLSNSTATLPASSPAQHAMTPVLPLSEAAVEARDLEPLSRPVLLVDASPSVAIHTPIPLATEMVVETPTATFTATEMPVVLPQATATPDATDTPTVAPTATNQPTATFTFTAEVVLTQTPSVTPFVPTATPTLTATQTSTLSATPSPVAPSVTPTRTFTVTATLTATPSATWTQSATPTPTPTPTPTRTATASRTPTPGRTLKVTVTVAATRVPLSTPTPKGTPYYGRCARDLDRKIVCVKFPGEGRSECAMTSDCFTPTPTPTPTITNTPEPTPTPSLSCICACRSQSGARELVCAEPWVFRVARLGYSCRDQERGIFPWSFERESSAVPTERAANYCESRWNGKEGAGYPDSSTRAPGVPCLLEQCREGVLLLERR